MPMKGRSRSKSGQSVDEGDDDDPELTTCGLGSWRPQWLQVFASPMYFMLNFSIVGIIQGMTYSIIIGAMNTLEKRYAFDSRISGFILIADNISNMLMGPICGYLGSRLNRPRMIAISELILGVSCITTALPYFIYGPGTHLLHDNEFATKMWKNETRYELCPANSQDIDCVGNKYSTVWPAVLLLWIGSFCRGIGFTAYYVVGLPFVDDNLSKNSSPFYLSVLSAFRVIGPALGFLLAGFTLNYYENPFYDPGVSTTDPRFIGAWWIGFIVIGVLLFITSLPMFLFPNQFKGATIKVKELKDEVKGVKAVLRAAKRMFFNPIVMLQFVGEIIRYLGMGGYNMFKTKYMESHYRKSSSTANYLTGTTTILPLAVGLILGGGCISWVKPKPRLLLILMFVLELFLNFSVLSGMFLGCAAPQMPKTWTDGQYSLNAECNTNCDCTTGVFTPICSGDGTTTYFSPCQAGCTGIDRSTNTLSGCSCIGDSYSAAASAGYCQRDSAGCDTLVTYLIITTLGGIVASSAGTGSFLVSMRSVDPKDKSFVLGSMAFMASVLVWIPYPLIYGAITDSTCLIWERKCGQRGNCWVYDQESFKNQLHGWTFFFMSVGSLLHFVLIFLSNRITNFYDDEDKEESDEHQTTNF